MHYTRRPINIVIYTDEGAVPHAAEQALAFCRTLFGKSAVKEISAAQTRTQNWQAETNLYVVPGGPTSVMHKTLGEEGFQNLKHYVADGGRYMGFCGGAYFGCASVEFAKGDPELERTSKQELSFFKGAGVGPVYPNFEYGTNRGGHVVPLEITGQSQPFATYFDGGGFFQNAEQYTDVEILARYKKDDTAAVVLRTVGKGTALLSGAHIEYCPTLMNTEDTYLQPLLPQLHQQNEARQKICQNWVSKLLA